MSRKKIWIPILIVFILGLSAMFVLWLLPKVKQLGPERMLKRELAELLHESVHFDFESLDLSALENGVASLRGVELSKKGEEGIEWSVYVGNLQLKGFDLGMDGGISLSVEEILLDEVAIEIKRSQASFEIFKEDLQGEGSERNSELLKRLKIDSVKCRSGSLFYVANGWEANTEWSADFGEILYDSEDTFQEPESVLLQFAHSTAAREENVYGLSSEAISWTYPADILKIAGLSLQSKLSKNEFLEKQEFRKSHLRLKVPFVAIDQMDTRKLFEKKFFTARKIDIQSPELDIARDNRKELPDRVTQMPQQALRNLGIEMAIDEIAVENFELDIALRGKYGDAYESLFFSDSKVKIHQLQNVNMNAAAFRFEAQTAFLKECPLKLQGSYYYEVDDQWELQADAEGLSLSLLNPVIGGLTSLQFGSGFLEEMQMSVEGDRDISRNRVRLKYRGLKLESNKVDEGVLGGLLGTVAEELGGVLYDKEKNEKDFQKARQFELYRDKRKDFTGKWIDVLLEGALIEMSHIQPKILEALQDDIRIRRIRDDE